MTIEVNRQETDDGERPSERNFGLTFTGVFLFVGLIRLVHGGEVRWWAIAVAAVIAAVTFTAPAVLSPLNRAWFLVGKLLHNIVNPVVLAALFFVVVTPMAVAMRAAGKQFLPRRYEPAANTYWIKRPPGPDPDTMRNQF